MLSKLRARLTYANVIASLALFISLGGTSYGLATGSIGSREIRNNSVRGADVRNSSLSGTDVRNNRLTGADIRNDSLTGGEVLESSLAKVPSATAADTANSATSADNADKLDNLDSSEFVESCGPGSAAAAGSWFAPSLPTDGSFVAPNRFGGELGFACAGSGLTATKIAAGHYRIQTNGLGSGLLLQLANAEPGTGQTRFASSQGPFGADLFDVFVRDAAGTLSDPSYVSLVLIQTE